MPKSYGGNTSKLQLTVDLTTERIIKDMIPLGIHGPSKAEVAAWIIKTWIWTNQELLRSNGIELIKKPSE